MAVDHQQRRRCNQMHGLFGVVSKQVFQRFEGQPVVVGRRVRFLRLGIKLVGLGESHRPALAGHGHSRDVGRSATVLQALVMVAVEHSQKALKASPPHHVFDCIQAGGDGNNRFQASVIGPQVEHMYTAERNAPAAHPVRIDFRQGAQPGDRIAEVLLLFEWNDVVAWFASALTEVAVVEGQDYKSRLCETVGIDR